MKEYDYFGSKVVDVYKKCKGQDHSQMVAADGLDIQKFEIRPCFPQMKPKIICDLFDPKCLTGIGQKTQIKKAHYKTQGGRCYANVGLRMSVGQMGALAELGLGIGTK